jgi:hypothetical protein
VYGYNLKAINMKVETLFKEETKKNETEKSLSIVKSFRGFSPHFNFKGIFYMRWAKTSV